MSEITIGQSIDQMIDIIKNLKLSDDIPKYAEKIFRQGEILYSSEGFGVVVERTEPLPGCWMDKKGFCKVIEVYGENSLGFKVGDEVLLQLPYKRGFECSINTLDDKFLKSCYLFPTKDSAENAEEILENFKLLRELYDALSWRTDLRLGSKYLDIIYEF